jgi:amino acid transporter
VYWLSLAFLFPSALMASSSMAVYALGAHYVHLAGSRAYVFGASLAALVLITIANLVGLKFGKWLDNIGAVAAYLLCVAMTITAVVILRDHGSATPVNLKPQLNWAHMSFWAQIAFALTGLELAPILGGEIKNPERNLPRASLLAAPLAASYYILGTVALLVILPSAEIRPLNGIAQSAFAAAQITRFSWIGPTAAMLLIGAAIGQLMVFGAAASRLPYVLGANRMLPHALSRVHPRWHTPYASILFFGVLAVIFLSLAQLGDTLGGAFQTLLDLMAIAGLTPFLYIFAAAWKCGSRWSAISGAVVTAFAVVASLAPTAEIASVWRFELKLLGLSACLVISARILYNRSKRAP